MDQPKSMDTSLVSGPKMFPPPSLIETTTMPITTTPSSITPSTLTKSKSVINQVLDKVKGNIQTILQRLGDRMAIILESSPLLRLFIFCFVGLSATPLTIYTSYLALTSFGIFLIAGIHIYIYILLFIYFFFFPFEIELFI